MNPHVRGSSRAATLLALLLTAAGASCTRPPEAPPASKAEAPAAAAATVFDENFLRNEPKKYSQFREEVVIRYHFKDRKGGFFLDVGAAEPIMESTTHYLANELGWKGIAVDARPELAAEYAKHRPGTQFFSFLVTDHTADKAKFYLAGRLTSR